MRRPGLIAKLLGAVIFFLVLIAAFVTWGPYFRSANAPAPRARYIRTIGESGLGKLDRPIGVAVSQAGEVFVSDAGAYRVVVFSPDGQYLRAFGKEGKGPGELDRPMHLTLGPDGLLYVAEYDNDRVSVFKLDGTFVRHLATPGLDAPGGVAVDRRGTVFIPNFYGHDVLVLGSDDKLQRTLGRPGRIWHGELHYPTDVALAPDDSLWVADAYNHRLQRFVGETATDIVGWGLFGRAFGFRVATGLGIDSVGRVYGADFGHGLVRVFDSRGTPLETFGRAGRGPGEFDRPEAIAIDGRRIYVTDFGNHRLQEWRMEERSR